MILSKERLLYEAENTGFRPEILEKVIILMRILEDINKDAYLQPRLALKGGTALNLFYFGLPRLSVDADLNYIGGIEREVMIEERPKVEERIERICKGLGLVMDRKPSMHAGGKMIWRYPSALGNQGNIEIDLNYMYRIPLVPITMKSSVDIAGEKIENIAILDIHELAAGKLSALVDRGAARDVFDAHFIFHNMDVDDELLRILFIVYAAMSRKTDIRKFDYQAIHCDETEFQHRLVPMLKKEFINDVENVKGWSKMLLKECYSQFSRLLPFSENEQNFLTRIIDCGEIQPELICDGALAEKLSIHPALQWAAFNAKRNSKL
jgi:predicted nucleotidyltransferase component of viral defense system